MALDPFLLAPVGGLHIGHGSGRKTIFGLKRTMWQVIGWLATPVTGFPFWRVYLHVMICGQHQWGGTGL